MMLSFNMIKFIIKNNVKKLNRKMLLTRAFVTEHPVYICELVLCARTLIKHLKTRVYTPE